jgi:UDP-GlcNAc:undecaprenyl-phosphate GlcNAc-1-phosphate transferase
MPAIDSTLIAASLTAAVISFAVAGMVRQVALSRGVVVAPRPDRWHRQPTPTYGGVGVVAGLFAGATLAGGLEATAWPVLSAALALFVIGWFDDLMPMSALAKMVSSLAVAAFFVFSLTTVETITPMAAALTIVAMLWFGGLVNAINLLDNMDGLAAGIAAIAALGLAVAFPQELGPALVAVLIALAGGLVGFLAWNRNPAKMFMGNCGSLAVGGTVAAAATFAIARAGTVTAAAAAALILVVPIFDSAFVVLLRRLAGRSTTRGNIDHTSHRLVSAGFTDKSAVSLLYALGAAGSLTGYLVQTQSGLAWPVAAGFAIGVVMMALWLARVPAYAGQDFQKVPFAPLLSDLTFRWHAGEVLLDLVLITACYFAAYRIRFQGDRDLPVFLGIFSKTLPMILGCQLAALYVSGLYKRMWSTFGLHDLSTVIRAVGSGVVASVLVVIYVYKDKAGDEFSRSVFVIDGLLLTAAIVATRSSFRVFGGLVARISPHRQRVAIYGAGVRGQMLVREMLANDAWARTPVVFIDDDPSKRSRRLMGVPIRGTAAELETIIGKLRIEEVLISSPAIDGEAEARVRATCAARAVAVRRLFLDIK